MPVPPESRMLKVSSKPGQNAGYGRAYAHFRCCPVRSQGIRDLGERFLRQRLGDGGNKIGSHH